MKVYLVYKYTWYARSEYVTDSVWKSESDAIKRSEEIKNCFMEIEEMELQ